MFKITREENHFIVTFHNTNRFNCFIVEELSKQLSLFISTPGCKVSINFEGIDFIDSSGFNFFMILAEKAKEYNFKYRICHMSEEVKELINRIHLPDSPVKEALVKTGYCN